MISYCSGPVSIARLMGATAALVAVLVLPAQAAEWRSGVRNSGAASPSHFASWRGTGLGVVSGWIEWKKGWPGMYAYASGSNPRTLRSKSANVSFGHGLFPKGGSLAACAAGQYDDEQREVARRLANNGVGNAEIRLGWEASGDWYPWSAAGKSPEQWKSCFTRVAKAMKSAAPGLRIGWAVGPAPLIEHPRAPASRAARFISKKPSMSGARRGSAKTSERERRRSS